MTRREKLYSSSERQISLSGQESGTSVLRAAAPAGPADLSPLPPLARLLPAGMLTDPALQHIQPRRPAPQTDKRDVPTHVRLNKWLPTHHRCGCSSRRPRESPGVGLARDPVPVPIQPIPVPRLTPVQRRRTSRARGITVL